MIFTGDIAQPSKGASSIVTQNYLNNEFWFGNLEGSLITAEHKARKGVFNDVSALERLCSDINFKAFSIANNHLLDAAEVKSTQECLHKLEIPCVGGGKTLVEASLPLEFIENDGRAYFILSFGWKNIQCVPASETKEGVNPYTKSNVISSVSKALQRNIPVICFFHWNYELEKYPQPYDRHLAHELIDMGVEAVIGCHAHRVQPIEFYKGKPIVYGLGNFLFCQGHYFDGKLKFPKFCEEEYAFEINKDGYRLHYFHYDQEQNRLDYVKSADINSDVEFDGKAEFSGFSDKEYEKWFKKNRVQKKLLPIFYAKESDFGYWMKSEWIKIRGGLINLLTKMNLKSRNRANR